LSQAPTLHYGSKIAGAEISGIRALLAALSVLVLVAYSPVSRIPVSVTSQSTYVAETIVEGHSVLGEVARLVQTGPTRPRPYRTLSDGTAWPRVPSGRLHGI